MKTIIVQARMGSTRLPGKVMLPLAGKPMLFHVMSRLGRSRMADAIVLATTSSKSDDVIASYAASLNWRVYRGSEEDVLSRYYEAARMNGATVIVRVTSDCPLIDPGLIDECIDELQRGSYDFVSNCKEDDSEFPRGLDVRVCTLHALEDVYNNAKEPYQREHVLPYIWEHPQRFKHGPIIRPKDKRLRRSYRLVVDYPQDYTMMQKVYQALYKEGEIINVSDAIAFLDAHPEIADENKFCLQKPYK